MKRYFFLFLLTIALSASASAQSKVNVHFARGANSTKLSGSVSGYKYVDYVVGARGGQTMSVKLESASTYASFVIFDPAMDNVDGATEHDGTSGAGENEVARGVHLCARGCGSGAVGGGRGGRTVQAGGKSVISP